MLRVAALARGLDAASGRPPRRRPQPRPRRRATVREGASRPTLLDGRRPAARAARGTPARGPRPASARFLERQEGLHRRRGRRAWARISSGPRPLWPGAASRRAAGAAPRLRRRSSDPGSRRRRPGSGTGVPERHGRVTESAVPEPRGRRASDLLGGREQILDATAEVAGEPPSVGQGDSRPPHQPSLARRRPARSRGLRDSSPAGPMPRGDA